VKCIETRPPVYLVKDDHGEILEGTFYAEEIQKVINQDDVYKIQSVPKKRRNGRRVQYLVKWFGYPESVNSWIFKPDLQKRSVAVWSVSLVNGTEWHGQHIVLGHLWKKIPRPEIAFLCQVLILYTVIVVSIYNLTSNRRTVLWGRHCWGVVCDTCYLIPTSSRNMFYLTLPSNSSMDYFPDNTLTHFTTRLPQMMDLDGSCEIGLAEIQYPHSWYNIKQRRGLGAGGRIIWSKPTAETHLWTTGRLLFFPEMNIKSHWREKA
jgi:hypothetical protein